MYGKIFDSMYEGTLYGHWQAIVTLQQMLVLCNQDGILDMTPQAIAARTSIPLDIISKGLEVLAAPDPYSRTPGEDGRRIVLVDEHRPWGWRIVNHAKYQKLKTRAEKLEADRVRIADKRNPNKNSDVAESRKESQPVADVAHSDADSDVDKKREKPAARATRLHVEEIPPHWKAYCELHRKDLDPARVFEDFRDHWVAQPGKDGTKTDWDATWRKWVRNQWVQSKGPISGDGWWSSDASILAKARELRVDTLGYSTQQLKAKIQAKLGAQ